MLAVARERGGFLVVCTAVKPLVTACSLVALCEFGKLATPGRSDLCS